MRIIWAAEQRERRSSALTKPSNPEPLVSRTAESLSVSSCASLKTPSHLCECECSERKVEGLGGVGQ